MKEKNAKLCTHHILDKCCESDRQNDTLYRSLSCCIQNNKHTYLFVVCKL